jgi:hypothetical protein
MLPEANCARSDVPALWFTAVPYMDRRNMMFMTGIGALAAAIPSP